ncbi:unnamed protein product [Menidia menidia]|uniref:(Atlantic silverside) hypothetical protein n=1 Tax=Menidia menidia TaxID=238744 RepID=A0A8S4AVX7_9TELE|nr:unnamed protein product [Menidia menidia]
MVAKEIESKSGQKTRTIQVDFTHGCSIYPAIAEELQGLEIGILDSEPTITHMVNCNVLSVPQMTRLVLPGMLERGTGLIINVSSEMGVRPQPLLALYSATKAFVSYFSQCLHAEYKSKGITVQCVAPLMVSTNMTSNVRVNCLVKSASGFVREAMNTVGHTSYTSGCLSHSLQSVAFALFLPDWLRTSTFLIRKMRNLSNARQYERRVQNGKWMISAKEE